MTIESLDSTVTQLLGSAQVLTDPTSLVKELVDNAIDAKATRVDVLISANTIDKIQVRDNGSGIALDDIQLLGRSGCTSKLRRFEDTKEIGGTSLGFRGQAIASAVILGQVSVTTRTEDVAVASLIKLSPPGDIHELAKTSHPVGTTICVTDLFSKLPVRKQAVAKESHKQISNIKDLLQRYALARLTVRFGLKVLKSSKHDWQFAPHLNDGLREVVAQVIGRETASQCVEHTSENVSLSHELATQDTIAVLSLQNVSPANARASEIIIQAFLPRPDAEPTKIGVGQYVSVDSRPMSCTRGTLKKLVAIYKKYVSNTLATEYKKPKNPFLYLNIVCAVGSYDANVEPAKNDVMFEDEETVLSCAERLFQKVYGDLQPVEKNTIGNGEKRMKQNGFELLLTSRQKGGQRNPANSQISSPLQDTAENSHVHLTTSGLCSEPIFSSPPQDMMQDRPNRRRNSKTAREFFPTPVTELTCTPQNLDRHTPFEEFPEEGLCPGSTANRHALPRPNTKPRNRMSANSIPSLFKPQQIDPGLRTPRPSSDVESSSYLEVQSSNSDSEESQDLHTGMTQTSLYSWVRSIPEDSDRDLEPDQTVLHEDMLFVRPLDGISHASISNKGSLRSSPSNAENELRPSAIRLHNPKHDRLSQRNKSFTPHFRRPGRTVGQDVEGVTIAKSFDREPHHPDISTARKLFEEAVLERQSSTVVNLELEDALDFERRKEEATRRLRTERSAAEKVAHSSKKAETVVARSSPHKNRYNAAIAVLDAHQGIKRNENDPGDGAFKTSLPRGDSRAYLMKRQRSMNASSKGGTGVKRSKTRLLPLETSSEQVTQHVVLCIAECTLEKVGMISARLSIHDQYVQSGLRKSGLVVDPQDVPSLQQKLENLFEKRFRDGAIEFKEVEYDLGAFKLAAGTSTA